MTGTSSLELGGSADRYDEGSSSRCAAHCYENRTCYGGCCSVVSLILIILFSISWDVLEPTQYGLLRNTMTGQVDMKTVYTNGRHFVGPTQRFVTFPANLITLSYGNKRGKDNSGVIPARTGAGAGESSGGQPVTLSLSFQYQLKKESIPQIYSTFGENYDAPYLRFAQQALTNVAQQFTPSALWTDRKRVSNAMLNAVNTSLITQGYAHVRTLQLRSIGFQTSYEQTIINIQLQEQLRVTKSYQLEVTRVNKQVDLMQSEATATVVGINADATRQEAIIVGEANAAALQLEQQKKAEMYARMREHLNWTTGDFLQYVKMRALNGQPQQNVVVGVNAVGSVPVV